MPAEVERMIRKMTSEGHSYASAIRMLKSSGAIHQKGKHLAAGKGRKRRGRWERRSLGDS